MNLCYAHSDRIGYGIAGTRLHEALVAARVDVADTMPPLKGRFAGKRSEVHEVACWLTPAPLVEGWWERQRPVLLTMWETQQLPDGFARYLDRFDQVLVPSIQNLELFSDHHPNVARVPLGVDGDWWQPVRRTEGPTFDFLHSGTSKRKGADLAHRAFLAAFPAGSWDGPEPRLILRPRATVPTSDRVVEYHGKLSAEDERGMYEDAHCFLAPTRGEGWGLQPIQALASGMPTILTDAHGHAEFSHFGIGIPAKPTPASYAMYGEAGDWWEPDLDALVDAMRWVYDNRGLVWRQAFDAAPAVAHDFSWHQSARIFTSLVDVGGGPVERGAWLEADRDMFEVTPTRRVQASIGSRDYDLPAGQPAMVRLEVRRILGNAGYLP